MSQQDEEKKILRARVRGVLAELDRAAMADKSEAVCRIVLGCLTGRELDSGNIAVFAAHGAEVSLVELHQLLPDARFLYPLCRAGRKLSFHEVPHPDAMVGGVLGIREPVLGKHPEVPVEDVDCFLCPGLAFTREGGRLGHGGGYYDRVLAKKSDGILAIGLGFSEQVLDDLPLEKHDVLLDGLITEHGYQSCDRMSS